MDLGKIENTAIGIAQEAGRILRPAFQQSKEIHYKSSDIDLVTQYDSAVEALVIERLRDAFPEHQHWAEEGDYGKSVTPNALTWYIDPIDGTNNFAHGFPVFAISLALYQETQPLVGVIYDPLRDECFHAARDAGAFLTTAQGGRRPLIVSQTDSLLRSLLATGFPYDRHSSNEDNLAQCAAFLKRAQGLRRAGAAALDLAYVAAGRLDGFWEYRLKSWDVAAGVLLIEEAGGRVTTVDGQPFSLRPHVSLIASNGHIHEEMKEVLNGVARNAMP